LYRYHNTEAVRLCRERREITHVSVRPIDNEYDVRYRVMNRPNVVGRKWMAGYINHEYIDGLIEENDPFLANVKVIYSLIDVHYYLGDWIPGNSKEGDWYNAIGGNFFPLPGKYHLPFNEGMYVIDGESNVNFKARRSDTWYTHPLIRLGNAETAINFGWYSLVQASGNPDSFTLNKYAPSGFSTGTSIQSTWISDQLEHLKGTKTAPMVKSGLFDSWGERETEQFVQALRRSKPVCELDHHRQIQIFSYFTRAAIIRQYRYKREDRGYGFNWVDHVVGPKVKCEFYDILAPDTSDQDARLGLEEYKELIRLERED